MDIAAKQEPQQQPQQFEETMTIMLVEDDDNETDSKLDNVDSLLYFSPMFAHAFSHLYLMVNNINSCSLSQALLFAVLSF